MKMKRSLSLLVIGLMPLFFLPSAAYAVSYFAKEESMAHAVIWVPCRFILKDGLYFGAGLGYDIYKIRQAVNLIDANGSLVAATPALTASGLLGNVLIGYGRYFAWFYLGGEAFVKYSRAGTGFGIGAYDSEVDVRTSVGVSLLPGIKVSDTTLIYLRAGYDRTRFKVNENGTALGSDSSQDWGNGIDLGMGIETAIYPRLSLRGEYTYTSDSSFDTTFDTKFSPANNEVTLALIYHFSC